MLWTRSNWLNGGSNGMVLWHKWVVNLLPPQQGIFKHMAINSYRKIVLWRQIVRWLIGWLVGWLAGWLAGWLSCPSFKLTVGLNVSVKSKLRGRKGSRISKFVVTIRFSSWISTDNWSIFCNMWNNGETRIHIIKLGLPGMVRDLTFPM